MLNPPTENIGLDLPTKDLVASEKSKRNGKRNHICMNPRSKPGPTAGSLTPVHPCEAEITVSIPQTGTLGQRDPMTHPRRAESKSLMAPDAGRGPVACAAEAGQACSTVDIALAPGQPGYGPNSATTLLRDLGRIT